MARALGPRGRTEGGRKRKRRVERLCERRKMGARVPEVSLKCLRVSISALERDKDEEADGGERREGARKRDRERRGTR